MTRCRDAGPRPDPGGPSRGPRSTSTAGSRGARRPPTGSTSGRSGRSATPRRVGNYRPDRDGAARRVLGRGPARRRPRHRRRRARLRRARRPTAPIPSVRAQVDGDDGGRVGRPDVDAVAIPAVARRGSDRALDLALAEWGDGFAAASGRRSAAPAADRVVLLVPLLRARHPGRHRGEPAARSTTSSSTSTSCRSTTATRPRSATGWLLSDRFASLRRHRRPHPRGRPPGRHLGRAVPGGGAVGRSPGSTPTGWSAAPTRAPGWADQQLRGPRRDPPRRRGVPPRGLRHLPRPRHRLLQDRLHLRRGDGGPPGRAGVAGVEAYRHGLRVIREAIGPDAYLLGLRRADPAQRRPGRRHAGRPGHRATTSSPSTATSPSPRSGPRRRTAGGGPGSTAGSGSTTPTAWSPARTSSAGRSGPTSSSATAGCAPAATGSAGSTSGGWRPPAGCSAAG